ncbi:LCP family protein [Mycolicibacterium smegmatis]|jgi:LCP family protein required for cell wall assembly|uniref:Cell envelope-related function transcriptional attenuator common domain n=3 Tax=Mycolicibacterium smegmatis TaxID=1772 RepID=A0QNN5_MYCS2|nr:LCP family protein [Mycolicibacterium smegmatis]ABK75496.1 cell envelope-related function transcriptional attenuator common domain [Mycolicibacterium smegmatis MC2 155]AFP36585.1 Putative transcriptional regulator [Mycolicibacterium smegmatis MC2 155]AIU05388.1 transcriptional regulator [Mycolicibacterium smegmatis MC2 155]AIU12013.1 transcriptional regulator [Mycolicibacterium smegmatis]AIU18637.1 transcriptional regulator [Mycolicibacterium smegmatis]
MNSPAHALTKPRRRTPRRAVRLARRALVGLTAAAILAGTGMGWVTYHGALDGITTSNALAGESGSVGDTENILIMGLDSRLDQHGNPLPEDVYQALHAGDETVGGYNANVLIVVHLPGDGGPATAFSIPRDDYVDLAGCPSGICKGKVKQAYGFAYQAEMEATESEEEDPATREQKAREAGRKAEIATVRNLLGIPIDHFVEVTLGAFFEIAKAVAPITVCLNDDTSDPYSGADFRKGVQQIDAAQAMAFVRQRRDINDENFTDLDRTRRQQAFLAALVSALRQSGALSSPSKLRGLLDVTKQNVALDAGFDLASFTKRASALTDAPPTLYTLPIKEFGQNAYGEDINIIDVPTIRKIVHDLVSKDDPATTTATPDKPELNGHGATLDVINGSTYTGLAAKLQTTFAADNFTEGQIGDAEALEPATTIDYGPGADAAAHSLATELGVTATPSDWVLADTVRLTIGTDFPGTDYLGADMFTSTTSGASESESYGPSETAELTPITTVAATATGTYTPAPTDLSQMTASGIPCVK